MEQSKNTIFKLIEKINFNHVAAKKANENLTDSIRTIAKDTVSYSFEIEKSEITSISEAVGNGISACFVLLSKKNTWQRKQKIREFMKKKKNNEANLWNERNMMRNKLASLEAEDLFEIIKINLQYGFSGVSRHILKD